VNHIAAYQVVGAQSQEEAVLKYAPLVKRIAYHLMARMPPSVQVDDLIQAGMIGLLEAINSFNPDKGASFETFSGIRIRGSMLDEMRRGDWVPRSVHRNARRINKVIENIEHETGRSARDEEVAKIMEISLQEYHHIVLDISASKLSGYEDIGLSDDEMCEGLNAKLSLPHDNAQKSQFKLVLADSIEELPERERLVLHLYYDEELNLKEIGDVLGVTESRVSQIHSQALSKLQLRIQEWRD